MLSAILLQPATSKYRCNTQQLMQECFKCLPQHSGVGWIVSQADGGHDNCCSASGHDNCCSASGHDNYFRNAPKTAHPRSAAVISVYFNTSLLLNSLRITGVRKLSHRSAQPRGNTNRSPGSIPNKQQKLRVIS